MSSKRASTTRRLIATTVSVGLVVAMASSLQEAVAAPSRNDQRTTTSGNVIVLLRNQHTNLTIVKGRARSPRAQANRTSQAPVIAHARALGASRVHGFSTINAFAAHLTNKQAAALAADPGVAAIVPDLTLNGASVMTERARPADVTSPVPQSGAVCPSDPAKPLLEPEALQVTHTAYSNPATPQAQDSVDGTGVKVAFIADGVDINNPDFIRADGTHVFVDYQDFSGDGVSAPTGGAEAFGDASAIAAQGRQVYDLADYVNTAHPLPAGCNIQIRGMAPGASLIGLKVFGNSNTAPTSRFIQAVDYAVSAGADVLNESFGGNPFPDTSDDPITLADNAAIAAGVTVVASTGDAGLTNTIGSPATSPAGIIGVAATTTFRSYMQSTYAGAQLSNGTWISNNISGLSSGGTTQSGGVPDLAAPGDLGWALCTPDTTQYEECTNDNGDPSSIQDFGGTSQASPLTAGAAALVIEAYENTHHGARPSPALVKRFLTSTATDLGHPASEQGAGLLNSLGAVQAAESWRDANGTPSHVGDRLVVNKTQLRLHGSPGAHTSATLAVTNTGTSAQRVRASTRSFEHVVRTVDGSAPLNTSTAPTYVDAFGIPRSYVSRTFTVGKADRLDVSSTAPTGAFAGRIILIDPSGAYAAYSIPQGGGNYEHVDVRYPAAGTWTAYFALSQSSGFNGTFLYRVVQTDFTEHGSVSPATRTLQPGQTGKFTVHTSLPTSPSDLSASVQFHALSGPTMSVPMTLRAIVPPHKTTFTGTVTGGNGRGQNAESDFYRLQVPSGKRDLSIGLQFQDPDQLIFATLTAPDGQVYSFRSNVSTDEQSLVSGIQIFRRDPKAGVWLLDLNITTPASGQFLSSAFVGTVAYNTVDIGATLPHGRKLDQGDAVTIPVRVHNTGVTAMTYYADARRKAVGQIPLTELSGAPEPFPLPEPANVNPIWLVPTEVSILSMTATADQPVNADFFYQSGNPDRYSATNGNSATVDVAARMVSPGIWQTDLGQTGPFTGPAPSGSASVAATSTGRLFDSSVTSDGGDPWQIGVASGASPTTTSKMRPRPVASLDGRLPGRASTTYRADSASVSQTPLTLQPGQTGTLNVVITPDGAHGSVVRGDLFIDSFDRYTDSGDELTDLSYSYTIR